MARHTITGLSDAQLAEWELAAELATTVAITKAVDAGADLIAEPVVTAAAGSVNPNDLAIIEQIWRSEVDQTLLPMMAEIYSESSGNIHTQILDATSGPIPAPPSAAQLAYLAQLRPPLDDLGLEAWEAARTALVDGVAAGESIPELSERVRQSAGVSSRKATLAARTAVIGTSNRAAIDTARATGLDMRKQWAAAMDIRTRPTHLRANGQPQEMADPFMVGGHACDYPGDPSLPPSERYNCRCTVLFFFDDEEPPLPVPVADQPAPITPQPVAPKVRLSDGLDDLLDHQLRSVALEYDVPVGQLGDRESMLQAIRAAGGKAPHVRDQDAFPVRWQYPPDDEFVAGLDLIPDPGAAGATMRRWVYDKPVGLGRGTEAQPMVNAALRGLADMTPERRDDIRILDQLIDASTSDRPVTVYRGYTVGEHILPDDWENRDLTGFEWDDPGFLSVTDLDEAAEAYVGDAEAGGFLIEMRLPAGQRGLPVVDRPRPGDEGFDSSLTGLDDEGEIILPRGMRLRVVEDKGYTEPYGIRHLVVEPVDDIPRKPAVPDVAVTMAERDAVRPDIERRTEVEALEAPTVNPADEVEERIHIAYLTDDVRLREGRDFSAIADIRDQMPDVGRAQQDEVLRKLATERGVDIIPAANLKSVSPIFTGDDRIMKGAIRIGGEDQHAIRFTKDYTPPSQRGRDTTLQAKWAGDEPPQVRIELPDTDRAARAAPRIGGESGLPAPRLAPRRPATTGQPSFAEQVAASAKGREALKAVPVRKTQPRDDHVWEGFDVFPERDRKRIQASLIQYERSGFTPINSYMRSGVVRTDVPFAPTRAELDQMIADLNQAFDASHLQRPVTVYRGLGTGRGVFGDPDTWPDDLTGREWTEQGMFSTSASKKVADEFGQVQLRLVVPQGNRALVLSGSGPEAEAEILLPPGMRFRVIKDRGVDKDGKRRLDVEVIPEAEPPGPPAATLVQDATRRGMRVTPEATAADVRRAIELDENPAARPPMQTAKKYPDFDESQAKVFAPQSEEKIARIIVAPEGGDTTIEVPQWGPGSTQTFKGTWVEVQEPDGSGSYGSALAEWLDMHERVPGTTDRWQKTATVAAYRAKGGERIRTILADGTEEVGGGRVAKEGQWIVRQKNGEVQIIDDAKFRRLYQADTPRGPVVAQQPPPQVPAAPAPLAKLPVAELRKIAKAEGVELPPKALKRDIVAAIEKRRAAGTPTPSAPPAAAVRSVRDEFGSAQEIIDATFDPDPNINLQLRAQARQAYIDRRRGVAETLVRVWQADADQAPIDVAQQLLEITAASGKVPDAIVAELRAAITSGDRARLFATITRVAEANHLEVDDLVPGESMLFDRTWMQMVGGGSPTTPDKLVQVVRPGVSIVERGIADAPGAGGGGRLRLSKSVVEDASPRPAAPGVGPVEQAILRGERAPTLPEPPRAVSPLLEPGREVPERLVRPPVATEPAPAAAPAGAPRTLQEFYAAMGMDAQEQNLDAAVRLVAGAIARRGPSDIPGHPNAVRIQAIHDELPAMSQADLRSVLRYMSEDPNAELGQLPSVPVGTTRVAVKGQPVDWVEIKSQSRIDLPTEPGRAAPRLLADESPARPRPAGDVLDTPLDKYLPGDLRNVIEAREALKPAQMRTLLQRLGIKIPPKATPAQLRRLVTHPTALEIDADAVVDVTGGLAKLSLDELRDFARWRYARTGLDLDENAPAESMIRMLRGFRQNDPGRIQLEEGLIDAFRTERATRLAELLGEALEGLAKGQPVADVKRALQATVRTQMKSAGSMSGSGGGEAAQQALARVLEALKVRNPTERLAQLDSVAARLGMVRSGQPLDVVRFDPNLHHPIGPAIRPGDTVTIVRPGYAIDTPTGQATLVRADVRTALDAETGRVKAPAVAGRRAVGTDQTTWVSDSAEYLDDVGSKAGIDPALREIGEHQGFGGVPTVVSERELNDAIDSGWVEIWRGVASPAKVKVEGQRIPAARIAEQFRTGPYEPGSGAYGNGYYMSARRMTAEQYRGRQVPFKDELKLATGPDGDYLESALPPLEPINRGGLLRMAIDPQARIIDYPDLSREQERWLDELARRFGFENSLKLQTSEAARLSPDPELRNAQHLAQVMQDPGRYAAARGYDGIRIPGELGGGDGAGYPEGIAEADQYIIFNRTILRVQRGDDSDVGNGPTVPTEPEAPEVPAAVAEAPADINPEATAARAQLEKDRIAEDKKVTKRFGDISPLARRVLRAKHRSEMVDIIGEARLDEAGIRALAAELKVDIPADVKGTQKTRSFLAREVEKIPKRPTRKSILLPVNDAERAAASKALEARAKAAPKILDLLTGTDDRIEQDELTRAFADVLEGEYPGGLRIVDVSAHRSGDVFSYGGAIQDAAGETVGYFDRFAVRHNGKWREIHHHKFFLDPEVHGSGLANMLNRALFGWYRRSGFKQVTVGASDIGSYTWAAQGFDFASRQALREFLDQDSGSMIWNSSGIIAPGRFTPEYIEQQALLDALIEKALRGEWVSAYEFSQVGRKPGQGKLDWWIGKEFMLRKGGFQGVKKL